MPSIALPNFQLCMHSVGESVASQTEPKWFMFESSSYGFGVRIRRFSKLNVNNVYMFLLYRLF